MPRSREREIKGRIRGRVKGDRRKTECKFFSHTHFTKFPVSGGSVELTWSSECKRPLEAPSVYFAGHVLKTSERESSEGDTSGDAVAKTGQKVLRSDPPTFKLPAGSLIKLDYKTQRVMILNPSRTHTTFWQHHSFQKHFFETSLHKIKKIQCSNRRE